ncbi:MAG: aminopeptidase P family protein [Muribaculaceae bacterium]|nr:aminopeptidase P family protein [Muribaculaceae bacterium]
MTCRTDKNNINLLGHSEQNIRLERLKALMAEAAIERALIRDNANIYYLTGRVFRGYIYIDIALERPLYFVRQPKHLHCEADSCLFFIRKPEEIANILSENNIERQSPVALELDAINFSEALRLSSCFGQTPEKNLSPLLRQSRAIKTLREQDMLRASGVKQSFVYGRLPRYFREGMTDIEFQIEIERASRLEGCLGQFRVAGGDMELFMGNVLTGDNGDNPSPYDFAMGGEGADPSLPVGANGTVIRPSKPVMVDVNGNYNGYMTDMTRMYISGNIPPEVEHANNVSIEICNSLAAMMKPGVKASELYNKALEIATAAGLADNFMGHNSHAGFVGHGCGIEVNELPVLAPRSRDVLAEGNVIAVEPKFVIPGIGAVGIENTYIVHKQAPAEVITTAPTEITTLD